MFNPKLIPAEALLKFQIEHYTKRFNEEKTIEAKAFLRKELYYLKLQLKSKLN